MNHTLHALADDVWLWTYVRGIFFATGACTSRPQAIRQLWAARAEASKCVNEQREAA